MIRYRGLSDGERAILNDMRSDMDGAPDIRVLWQREPIARKPHRCDRCGEEIAVGTKYESVGLIEDGTFRHDKMHRRAYEYPSGCPRFKEKDRGELEEQFAKDQEAFFPESHAGYDDTFPALHRAVRGAA